MVSYGGPETETVGLMMKLFLQTGRAFDAVVCYNDQIAIQVMDALRLKGSYTGRCVCDRI